LQPVGAGVLLAREQQRGGAVSAIFNVVAPQPATFVLGINRVVIIEIWPQTQW